MQAPNMILRFLEEQQLVAHALADEDAARVLGYDGLFVLGNLYVSTGKKC